MNMVFDLVLCLCLAAVAARVVFARGHFHAIVLFITFGLLLSLAWTRLKSPDIAIAEAAVGAGLTGVLLMDALGSFSSGTKSLLTKTTLILSLPFLCLVGILVYAVLHIPGGAAGLASQVQSAMADTSLEYSVTAVLLDFRSYDTWLELGVLLAGVLGVLCVRKRSGIRGDLLPAPAEPVGKWVIKMLLPIAALAGGYLLWLGAFAPGGAFQAGVVLAAGAVMLWQAGHPGLALLPKAWWRILLCSGFGLFLVLAVSSMFYADQPLAHPESKTWILGLEYAAAVSIAVCLVSLIMASPGEQPGTAGPDESEPDSNRQGI